MQSTKRNWEGEAKRWHTIALVVFFFAVAGTSAAISSWGLYFVRVNESRLVINCGSFISSDDATAFTVSHPQYKKRLNPKNLPKACSSHDYGTTN